MASTQLVPFERYEIAGIDPQALRQTMEENLGGVDVGALDLDRVKIPSGGATSFEVPTLEGTEAKTEIVGVIIRQRLVRAFWRDSLDESGGGNPPDCTSPDNVWGHGDPGDRLRAESRGCADCPMSDFGTAKGGEGRGQACQQRHQMFIAIPGEVLPILVSLPPTSLGNAKDYLKRLSSRVIPYYGIVTRITLTKERSAGGQDYAEAHFEVAERLEPAEVEKIRSYAESMAPILDNVRITDAPAQQPSAADVEAEAVEDATPVGAPQTDVPADTGSFKPPAQPAGGADVPFAETPEA
jgi:hypothetical protein